MEGPPEQHQEGAAHDPIAAAIEAARRTEREIDDATAREIVLRLTPEPGSALDGFACCGAIVEDDIYRDLYTDLETQAPEHQVMADALLAYCLHREDKGPIDRWDIDDTEPTPSGRQPAIWVGCLGSYNLGRLHGSWLAANREPAELQRRIDWILRTSPMTRATGEPAEEWAIFDHDDFAGVTFSEYASLETVTRLAAGIAEHGEAFAAYVDWAGTEEATIDDFTDHYVGTYDSLEAFTHDFADSMDWPTQVERFAVESGIGSYVGIDYAALGRDLAIEWHIADGEHGVHVFYP